MSASSDAAPRACLDLLSCPVCHEPLRREGGALVCARRHSFDVAREGYVNLLAGVKLPPLAGDTRAMLEARRRFLERGHYAPLADVVIELALPLVEAAGERVAVADAGCGEGSYLARLKAAFDATALARASAPTACWFGTDIARDATRLAARRHRDILFLVADTSRRLPFQDGALDVLLNLFAARSPAEFARVTRTGGLLLVALPQAHHLGELRARLPLIGIEPDKEAHVRAQLDEGFALVEARAVEHPLRLGPDDLYDLLAMTPSARHVDDDELEAARELGPLEATAAFQVLRFERR